MFGFIETLGKIGGGLIKGVGDLVDDGLDAVGLGGVGDAVGSVFDTVGGFVSGVAADISPTGIAGKLISSSLGGNGDSSVLGAMIAEDVAWPPSLSVGTAQADVLISYKNSSGNLYEGNADIISNFDASSDKLLIPEGLSYAGETNAPGAGQYSVWSFNGHSVVTWVKDDGSWSDIIVKGDNPLPAIETKLPDATAASIYTAGGAIDTFYGTEGSDIFKFQSSSTGDIYQGQADTVKEFDEDHDYLIIPEGLVFGGDNASPSLNEYTVWESDGFHVVSWYDHGYHDVKVEGDNPLGEIISGGDFMIV